MAVIELDRDWTPPLEPPRRAAVRRRWWALLVALVALVPAGSAVRPRSPAPVLTLADSGESTFQISGDVLYRLSGTPDGRGQVVAYRLPDGAPLWTSVQPVQLDALGLDPASGVLLGQAYRGPSDQPQMAALDAATGRLLWRADGAALAEATPDGRVLTGLGEAPDVLREVDLRTGQAYWSRPVAAGMLQAVFGQPRRIILQGNQGELWELDPATGDLLVQGQAVTPGSGLYVANGQLLVTYRRQLTNVIDAYDLATLAHRWQAESPANEIYVQDCGRVLCVASNGAMEALDPATGAHLWYGDAWQYAGPVGRYLLADGASTALIDPGTGRVVLPLDRWFEVTMTAGDTVVFATDDGTGTADGPGTTTLFAALDLRGDRPVLRPVLALPDVRANRCEVGSGYVACRVPDRGIRVWPFTG